MERGVFIDVRMASCELTVRYKSVALVYASQSWALELLFGIYLV